MDDKFHALFESGVAQYFRNFGHRQSREVPHQAWLLMSVSQYIPPPLVVAELQLPSKDLAHLGGLERSKDGALNFDFAVARKEIDMRTWKTRTPGWNRGVSTIDQTLETLESITVIAEFKIAASTKTDLKSLVTDLKKLLAVNRLLEVHDVNSFPQSYLVVLDPDGKLDVNLASETVREQWPRDAPAPKILVGPDAKNAT